MHVVGWTDFWAGFLLRMVGFVWLLNPVLAGLLSNQSRTASIFLNPQVWFEIAVISAVPLLMWLLIFG
jgi:hypothetical protein